jgi:hypothetical protein
VYSRIQDQYNTWLTLTYPHHSYPLWSQVHARQISAVRRCNELLRLCGCQIPIGTGPNRVQPVSSEEAPPKKCTSALPHSRSIQYLAYLDLPHYFLSTVVTGALQANTKPRAAWPSVAHAYMGPSPTLVQLRARPTVRNAPSAFTRQHQRPMPLVRGVSRAQSQTLPRTLRVRACAPLVPQASTRPHRT